MITVDQDEMKNYRKDTHKNVKEANNMRWF